MSIIYINPFQFGPGYDPDAQDFINRVIAADVAAGNTSGLEVGVQDAYNTFFAGCKADGNFSALKASCILAGARTLAGALVPLVGIAPTNNNFVAGDYDRKTGLKGDASTKSLNSNRPGNADPTSDFHLSTYQSEVFTAGVGILGQDGGPSRSVIYTTGVSARSSGVQGLSTNVSGFIGVSRATSTEYTARKSSTNTILATGAVTPGAYNTIVFARTGGGHVNSRLSFYSIGESLDLALLDARVSTLMSDLAAAIP